MHPCFFLQHCRNHSYDAYWKELWSFESNTTEPLQRFSKDSLTIAQIEKSKVTVGIMNALDSYWIHTMTVFHLNALLRVPALTPLSGKSVINCFLYSVSSFESHFELLRVRQFLLWKSHLSNSNYPWSGSHPGSLIRSWKAGTKSLNQQWQGKAAMINLLKAETCHQLYHFKQRRGNTFLPSATKLLQLFHSLSFQITCQLRLRRHFSRSRRRRLTSLKRKWSRFYNSFHYLSCWNHFKSSVLSIISFLVR